MSDITYIPRNQFAEVPWKNGKGVTLEIDRKNVLNSERFKWRLSIATVDHDGAFSYFECYQRIISVLQGKGMILDVDGQKSGSLLPFHAFAFSGDANTQCQLLDGVIADFNVIYDPSQCSAQVEWLEIQSADDLHLVLDSNVTYIISGQSSVDLVLREKTYQLQTWDILKIAGSGDAVTLASGDKKTTNNMIGIVKINY
ncbi:HutD/Ves family protein [Vibrio viridaestus]|uniref:HutD family protein n=1 Tax=Vibrio viridaestus TaxID=2487322 RepID=A0A3N9TJJ3_9VIBR|nr:HutD family protein [Vibrio viridaestus]RQW64489.1 HutD family protein [Vibrio viridaestus]